MATTARSTTSSQYLHPYYIFNVSLILLFIVLRLTRLSGGALSRRDPLGFTRESQIYLCLSMMLFVRTLSAPSLHAYFSHAFNFTRVAILFLLYVMNTPLCFLFATLWTIVYVLFPQPLPKSPAHIKTLNPVTLKSHILQNRLDTTYHFLYCHTPWATKCVHLLPVYNNLSKKYSHVRFHWAKIDLGRHAAMAKELDVSLAVTGKSLPTLLCFRGGKEIGRIEGGGRVTWRVDELADLLKLKEKKRAADQWEKEAKRKYRKEVRRKKGD